MEYAWHSTGNGVYEYKDADGYIIGTVSLSIFIWTAKVRGIDPERFTSAKDARNWVEDKVSERIREIL